MFSKHYKSSIDRAIALIAVAAAISASVAFGNEGGTPCDDPLSPRCRALDSVTWGGCSSTEVGSICTSTPHIVMRGECVSPGNSSQECTLTTASITCKTKRCLDYGIFYDCGNRELTVNGWQDVTNSYNTMRGFSDPNKPCNYHRIIDGPAPDGASGCN